jgi:hypothetical protein
MTETLDVFDRDSLTMEYLQRAELVIEQALKVMPNHVDSVFDPANDVPMLTGARDRVRDALRYAQEARRSQEARA